MIEVSTPPNFLSILTAATTPQRSERPPAKTVIAALLQAETTAKQQQLAYAAEDLLGEWRLCFATGVRKVKRGGIEVGRGFYLPTWVQAKIGLDRAAADSVLSSSLGISNQVQVGSLRFQILGPAKYLKKNLLAFDFTQMELVLLGKSIYRSNFRGGPAQHEGFDIKPIGKLPFFSFFLITDDLLAARGRGGGLAVWSRQRD